MIAIPHYISPEEYLGIERRSKVNYQDDFYYYPDAFVTCEARDRAERYIKRYPKLVSRCSAFFKYGSF